MKPDTLQLQSLDPQKSGSPLIYPPDLRAITPTIACTVTNDDGGGGPHMISPGKISASTGVSWKRVS